METSNGTGITTTEITEDQILNTLDAGFRTIGGIKKKLGVPAYKDISVDIDFLVEAKKVVKISNGTLTAYFRADEKPEHIWLAGDGRVNARFAGDDEAKVAAAETAPRKSNKKVAFTADDLERAAAENKNQPAVAKALGCSSALLYIRLKDANLRAAYDRGLAKRGTVPHTKKPAAKKPEPSNPVSEKMTPVPVVEASVTPPEPPEVLKKPVQSRFITFGRGGQLLLAYEGSLFDLRRDEFELITAISDLLNTFEGAE